MFYRVKILSPKGKLKKTISSKKLADEAFKKAMSEGLEFGFPLKITGNQALYSWRKMNALLDEVPSGRSER